MGQNKNVVLGITGSIAVYKAGDLCRRLVEKQFAVNCILTACAQKFVTALTFQTLSQNQVYTDLFAAARWEIEHISLAEKAGLILIAPATAEIISRLAAGRANDLLTATVLSSSCPVLIAPAMNEKMFLHPLTQKNIQLLKNIGYRFVEPESGGLACGRQGVGRLASIENILSAVDKILSVSKDLLGKKILITAGPTREYLDPVRFISNGSSGEMGYTLAEEAALRGAEVVLVSGPTNRFCAVTTVKVIKVDSAREMKAIVEKHFSSADIVIACAAVADYRPGKISPSKIKKRNDKMFLELVKNPDILAGLGAKKGKKKLVGFALETENLERNARKKLREKNLDLIIANKPEAIGAKAVKQVIILSKTNKTILPSVTKQELAKKILNLIGSLG
ncbi:MAG: bifunctional phosphopantothenoylcysteine decarboxylase/phosphopantothenate--cysteine ligase CoaBC [Elusimicrobiota bacterium]